jgi:proteasome accessory factor B
MNAKRITRLVHLLQMFHSGGAHNADGLATACGVCRRTVFRDMEALRATGLPISFDSDHDRYSVSKSHYLPPIDLNPAEALSLVALATEMGQSDRLPFYDSAKSAALKLESGLPAALREELRRQRRTIRIQPSRVSRLKDKEFIFHQLLDARVSGRVIQIEYDCGPSRNPITTKLRTYHLFFCRHRWYVIGRSSMHRGVRTFNLNLISDLKPTDQRYTIPRSFHIDKYLGNAWVLSSQPGPDENIEVHFTPTVARNVAEVNWHRTQQLEFKNDGSLVFRARVSGLNEIVWWILSFGDQAEVVQPEQLRQMVANRARNMAALYEGKNCSSARATR